MPLIVLEGPEGAGKSTQIPLIADWLTSSGKTVVTLREPGGTQVGDWIRQLVLHAGKDVTARAEALLYMASRAEIVEREIQPALKAGKIVLLDRFFLATYAYQGAGRGLPLDLVAAANRLATSDLRPDLTVLLTLRVEEGFARIAKRGAHDRIEQAEQAFHQRVAEAYAEFATPEWQKAHPEAGRVVTVDARGSEQQVSERIRRAIEETLR